MFDSPQHVERVAVVYILDRDLIGVETAHGGFFVIDWDHYQCSGVRKEGKRYSFLLLLQFLD